MSDAALRLAGISKAYNRGKPTEVDVLRGVDLEVARGEVVALVAPAGAGNSTLLHIAGLLDTADAGTVAIAGEDLTRRSDRRRRRMIAIQMHEHGQVLLLHHSLHTGSRLAARAGIEHHSRGLVEQFTQTQCSAIQPMRCCNTTKSRRIE